MAEITELSTTGGQVDAACCLNCNAPLQAQFCAQCGQQVREVKRPVLSFLKELLRVLLELDGRAYRTVGYLLTRPGFLTLEYFSGKRVKYTPPLRLFLVVSISFFLSVSLFNTVQSMQTALDEAAGDTSVQEQEASPDPADDNIPDTVVVDETEEGVPGIEEAVALLENLQIPFLTAETNQNLGVALGAQLRSNVEEIMADPEEFFVNSLEYITFFILLMVPVLALIQQILWLLSRRFYVEHLVLTLHNHAYVLLMMFIFFLVGLLENIDMAAVSYVTEGLRTALAIWIFVYLYLSLKNYFQAGWLTTAVLFGTACLIYSIVMGTAMLAFGVLLVLFG